MKPITCTREELENNPKLQKETAHRSVTVHYEKDQETGVRTEILTFSGYTESMIRKATLLKKKPSELTKTEINTPYKTLKAEVGKKNKKAN